MLNSSSGQLPKEYVISTFWVKFSTILDVICRWKSCSQSVFRWRLISRVCGGNVAFIYELFFIFYPKGLQQRPNIWNIHPNIPFLVWNRFTYTWPHKSAQIHWKWPGVGVRRGNQWSTKGGNSQFTLVSSWVWWKQWFIIAYPYIQSSTVWYNRNWTQTLSWQKSHFFCKIWKRPDLFVVRDMLDCLESYRKGSEFYQVSHLWQIS